MKTKKLTTAATIAALYVILTGLAKLMGLPIGKLVCASNANNVLTDFLCEGTYDRNRAFHLTMSPSMSFLWPTGSS